MDGDDAEIERGLDRMHRQPRPGSDMDVAVMDGAEMLVHPLAAQQPVNPEKCALSQNGIRINSAMNQTGPDCQSCVGIISRPSIQSSPHSKTVQIGTPQARVQNMLSHF